MFLSKDNLAYNRGLNDNQTLRAVKNSVFLLSAVLVREEVDWDGSDCTLIRLHVVGITPYKKPKTLTREYLEKDLVYIPVDSEIAKGVNERLEKLSKWHKSRIEQSITVKDGIPQFTYEVTDISIDENRMLEVLTVNDLLIPSSGESFIFLGVTDMTREGDKDRIPFGKYGITYSPSLMGRGSSAHVITRYYIAELCLKVMLMSLSFKTFLNDRGLKDTFSFLRSLKYTDKKRRGVSFLDRNGQTGYTHRMNLYTIIEHECKTTCVYRYFKRSFRQIHAIYTPHALRSMDLQERVGYTVMQKLKVGKDNLREQALREIERMIDNLEDPFERKMASLLVEITKKQDISDTYAVLNLAIACLDDEEVKQLK